MIPGRICSLLPSATEIVCALGLGDRLVGVTHECDYPPEIIDRAQVTSSVIDSTTLSAGEIDLAVRESLADEATIYRLDRNLLDELQPDIIITQDLCPVCAVGPAEVRAVVESLRLPPPIVSLDPHTLGDVLDSIMTIGEMTGAPERAARLVQTLRDRMENVRAQVAGAQSTRVLTVEWIDPLFVGGHWVPEMVALAGGHDVLGAPGQPSRQATWDEGMSEPVDAVVVMLCGFDIDRSLVELDRETLPRVLLESPAMRNDRVYVVDGSAYFSRPGPRLVDGVELLASIFHPDRVKCAPVCRYATWSSQ